MDSQSWAVALMEGSAEGVARGLAEGVDGAGLAQVQLDWALMRAAGGGGLEAVELLLGAGADPLYRDENGSNALMAALMGMANSGRGKRARGRHGDCALALLPVSEVDVVSSWGRTACMFAACSEDSRALEAIATPARARMADADGATPLHYACKWGSAEAARILAPMGAVFARDRKGATPLAEAAFGGWGEIAMELMAWAPGSMAEQEGALAARSAAKGGHAWLAGQIRACARSLAERMEIAALPASAPADAKGRARL